MSSLLERAKSIPKGIEVIGNWLGEGGIPVTPDLAQQRANICINCPLNKKGNSLIAVLARSVHMHVRVKNKLGIRVLGEKKLGECGVCMCDLKLKVHVPIKLIRRTLHADEVEQFPTYCWQISEPHE